jgi:hypothetical protein
MSKDLDKARDRLIDALAPLGLGWEERIELADAILDPIAREEIAASGIGEDTPSVPTPVAPETGGLVRWDARIKPDEDWTPYAAARATIANLKRERDDLLAKDQEKFAAVVEAQKEWHKAEAALAVLRERVGEVQP